MIHKYRLVRFSIVNTRSSRSNRLHQSIDSAIIEVRDLCCSLLRIAAKILLRINRQLQRFITFQLILRFYPNLDRESSSPVEELVLANLKLPFFSLYICLLAIHINLTHLIIS